MPSSSDMHCSENQVTPFSLATVDGETLYAWHILPLPLYSQHESDLSAPSSGFNPHIESSLNFKLLRDDPDARLVLYCEFRFPLRLVSHTNPYP